MYLIVTITRMQTFRDVCPLSLRLTVNHILIKSLMLWTVNKTKTKETTCIALNCILLVKYTHTSEYNKENTGNNNNNKDYKQNRNNIVKQSNMLMCWNN